MFNCSQRRNYVMGLLMHYICGNRYYCLKRFYFKFTLGGHNVITRGPSTGDLYVPHPNPALFKHFYMMVLQYGNLFHVF